MLTREEEHRLRDRWTIQLLEATSPAWVVGRVDADERADLPAYDPCPLAARPVPIAPRDLWIACPTCGERFVAQRTDHRYCAKRCAARARQRRGLGPCPVLRVESTAPRAMAG